MKIKIDFRLNRQFGIVERIIFRLVLGGFRDAREIAEALPVFSDTVIVNSIKTLVNRQILSAQIESHRLALSEAAAAMIEMCMEKEHEIDVPPELEAELQKGGLLIAGASYEPRAEAALLKKAIVYDLLPGIKPSLYTDSLDFILYEDKDKRGGQDE